MKQRSTMIAIVLLLALAGSFGQAQLLNENFNFSGALTANNWTGHSGTGTNPLSTTGGLTFAGSASSDIGNAVLVAALGGEDVNMGLTDSIYTNGTAVYTSFLVNVNDTAMNRTGDYFFHLGNRNNAASFSSFTARVFGRIVDGNVNFGISNLSTAGAMKYSAVNYAKNTTYQIIVKYTINTGGIDTVKMWVKSAGVPASEAAAGTPDAAADSSIQTGQNIIDAAAIRQGSVNSPALILDGVRVDTNWANAVGYVAPVSGKIYSIGTGNVPGETEHYASLKAACDSINAHISEIAEDRIYYITSDLTEPANVTVGGNISQYTITFKPYTGVQPTITFTQVADNTGLSAAWVIGLKSLAVTSATNYGVTLNDSCQNIIIDGSNTPGGTTRDLSLVTAAGISGNTNAVRIFGNTNNIVLKNFNATMGQSVSYAILITVRQTATVGYAGNYVPDNIVVENCNVTNTFGNAAQGIAISNSGTPTAFPTGVVFKNNKVTARTRGIFLNNSGNTDVYGNEINVIQTNTGSLSEGIFAFTTGSALNTTNIYNNRIQILTTGNVLTGTGAGIIGIWIATQGTYNVYNNIVTGFSFPNLAQGLFVGIGVATATANGITANIHHNSVYMANGANTAGATPPIQTAFYMSLTGASGTRAVNLSNNIFAQYETDYATHAIYVTAANLGTLTSNYNNLYSAGGSGFIGRYGATDCDTLSEWTTASLQDANSVSGAPGFVSGADLHINPNGYPESAVSNAGTPVALVTTDMDGEMRSLTTPDIGADEYVATPVPPSAGFMLSTKTLAFGNVWKDSTKTDSVFVTNPGTTLGLTIDSVKSSNPLFVITPLTASVDTSGTKSFMVTFSPTAKGPQSGLIVFYHNAPTAIDTLMVNGNGIIKEALFAAVPPALVFKGVLVGASKTDSIAVQNAGTDSLHITGVTSSDAVFTVTPGTAHLAPSQTLKFAVTFSPVASGAKSAKIFFANNTAEGQDTVNVYGTVAAQVTIGEARKDVNTDLVPDYSVSKDTMVITGVVTSPNFQTTGTSYYIQDNTGGINIFSFNPSATALLRGDSIMVVGTVAQFRGLTEFLPLTLDAPNFVVLKSNAALPAPKRLTSKEFVTSPEMYEGQLIEIDSLFKSHGTWPGAAANGSVYLTNQSKSDTIQLFIDADSELDGATEPAYPINVIGLLVQYSSGSTVLNNGYEIVPRDMSDIIPIIIAGVNDGLAGIPDHFELYNNYPNPFNPSTTIKFALPSASTVTLKIYDAIGREVASPVNEILSAGYHHFQWNASHMASGVYYYRLSAVAADGNHGSFTNVKKLLLLK